MKSRKIRITAPMAAFALLIPLAACSDSAEGSDGGSDDGILRVAMGSPGEAQIRVWDEAAAEFEEEHGVKVEMNYQEPNLYETIGLPNLLNGRNAPDVYFEWAGSRIETRKKDGFVVDLTSAVEDGPIAGLFDDDVFDAVTIDGEIVLIPQAEDVTNVLWYNTDIFDDHGITPPEDWDGLLAICEQLHEADIIPISSGNKDLWAAGNWLGHVTSRVVGEELYDSALAEETDFNTSEWISAFERVKELADHNCVNTNINAIDDTEGAQLFFQGKAAMHAIGSWIVSWAIDEAPGLNFDYFNLPAMPGEGNQESVIGVITGHTVNAKSSAASQELGIKFLALINSDKYVDKFIEAELTPMTKHASEAQDLDSRSADMVELLETAPAIVLPPDTGYDLEVAEAFYQGLAEVIGGQSTPEEAVEEIQRKIN